MSPKAFTEPLVGEARPAFRKAMADHLKPFVAGAAWWRSASMLLVV
jgi:hypothetical protein